MGGSSEKRAFLEVMAIVSIFKIKTGTDEIKVFFERG